MAKYWVTAKDRLGEMEIAVEADSTATAALRAGIAITIAVEDGVDLSQPLDTVIDPEWDSSAVITGLPKVISVVPAV